jgi:hypothetical protein
MPGVTLEGAMTLRVGLVGALRGIVRRRRATGLLVLLAALGPVGCKLFDSTCGADDRTCLGGGQARSGQACIRNGDCAVGLTCKDNACDYGATTKRGNTCIATPECADGLYCSPTDLQCRPLNPDPKKEGEGCSSSADCQRGLVCDVDVAMLFAEGPYSQISDDCRAQQAEDTTSDQCKLPRTCLKRGTVDIGGVCKTNSDCVAGLYCIPDPIDVTQNVCYGGTKLPFEPVSVPLWGGDQCPADSSDAVAYFEVPRKNADAKDFYRLPFPNDIRKKDGGGIDLSGHPRPPDDLDPPAARRFIDAAATVSGFATNPVIIFRFSQAFNNNDRSAMTMRIIDITPSSPEYGRDGGIFWAPSERRSNYVCPHFLALHRPFDTPLRSNTTYAAIITTGLHTTTMQSYERSPDFDAVLASSRPSDSDLARAWDAYAPLRAFLSSDKSDLNASDLLNAAVFTTQDATGLIPKLRAAIEADGVAQLRDLTRCGSGVKSPCEDDTGRGACQPDNPDFVEIHGHVLLPAFQRGTAPYENPEDGGDIAVGSDGKPEVQGHPSVCFALSVPKKTAPDGGYPLLLVAHGTGGSFADQMQPGGLAGWAAKLDQPSAVLGIDMPVHGSRRNGSTRDPQDLFFNFNNPQAARGNAVQGAADLIGLALLATQPISAGASPTGAAIRFNGDRVALYAHSQGATHASLMIGSEPRIRAVVLSGIGGHISTSLREKQKPIDMSAVLPFMLFDPDTSGKIVVEAFNPMLALVQTYLDSADPLNYASQLALDPPASASDGHDVFMTYGRFDSFTPEDTQQFYAKAGGLPAVEQDLAVAFNEIPSPAIGNLMPGSKPRTVALRTYDPHDDAIDPNAPPDGHFVATQTTRGLGDTRRFLEGALQGGVPQIGQ